MQLAVYIFEDSPALAHHMDAGGSVLCYDPYNIPPVKYFVGLKPVLLAHLQLGYYPDSDVPLIGVSDSTVISSLDRSVHNSSVETTVDYLWAACDCLVEGGAEARGLEPLEAGVVYDVAYNGTMATEWASGNCVASAGKRFGDCKNDGGVVLQERAGKAVLLAVGFDVRVVGPDGETELTVVVKVGG